MSESLREKAKRHPQTVNRLLIVVALVCLCTLVVVSAVFQSKQAETNSAATQVALANTALERERAEAHSIALAAQARQLFNDGQGSLALALALEAAQLQNPPIEAHNILADILYAPGIKEWHPLNVINPVISHDASTLAYKTVDELVIMDVASWTERNRIDLQSGNDWSRLVLNRITSRRAFMNDGYTTIVFAIDIGRELYRFTGQYKLTANGQLMLRYQPDMPDQHAELWDVSTGQVIKALPNLSRITGYTGIVFSEDNHYLYLYDRDRLMVYDIANDILRSADVPIVKQPLTLLPYTTADGHPYILLGDQEIAYFWDVETLTRTAAVSASSDIRLSTDFAALSPNHRLGVVFGPNQSTTYLQYLEAPKTLYPDSPMHMPMRGINTWNPTELTAPDAPRWISDVVFSRDSQKLYVLAATGLAVWDVSRGNETSIMKLPLLHDPRILHYSENSIYLTSMPNQRKPGISYPHLYRLDAPDWNVTYQYHDLAGFVMSIDAKLLLVGRKDPSDMSVTDVSVLDVATNTVVARWQSVGFIADISPDNKFVLTAGTYEQGMSVRDVMTGEERYVINYDPTNLSGRWLGLEGTLWLWDHSGRVTLYNAAGEVAHEYKEIDYDFSARTIHMEADNGEVVYVNFDTAQTSYEPPAQPRLKILAEAYGSYQLVDTQQNRTLAQWQAEFFIDPVFARQLPQISDDGKMIYGVLDDVPVFWRIHTTEELIQLARETRYIPELTCEQRELYRLMPCESEATTTP
jgi:hypothetical protein